ncbi:hypothetical protein V8C37DRAFT_376815 [Trichoderma ceciliae]
MDTYMVYACFSFPFSFYFVSLLNSTQVSPVVVATGPPITFYFYYPTPPFFVCLVA